MKTIAKEKKTLNKYDDIKERQLKRKKRRKIRRITFRFTLLIGFLAAIVLSLMFLTPFFNLKTIEVVGNEKITTEKIVDASGILEGQNVFRVNQKAARDQIGLLPYIKNVTVHIKLPNKIVVKVTESKMIGYIPYMNSYVGIDENCKSVEISDKPVEAKTRIDGLEITNATLGTPLEVSDKDKFNVVSNIMEVFFEANLFDKVTSVNVEKLSDITFFYDDRIKVVCGGYENFEKKVMLFQGVNSQIGEKIKGVITLTADGKAIFSVE